ncbi:MAG: hypothetical protein N4A38_00205 [Candidatus Gracilibacteria bacterium]|nr:hypothetical protein [Candidatus Gracilibacteria bacterium]
MNNIYGKKQNKKWDKLFNELDDAHIVGLKQLAKQMKTGDLDGKEIRANIALFKAEKGEKENLINKKEENLLKKRLEKIMIKNTKKN